MDVINWYDTTYKNKALRGGNWSLPLKFISEGTMSGKKKRRIRHTNQLPQVSVIMNFTSLADYNNFLTWFEEVDKFGFFPFYFPRIDGDGSEISVYQFVEGSEPSLVNTSGQTIQVTMNWERL